MLIYLVGMPSSGKSTLGKQLASALGFDFIDLDAEIVKREQQTISEIFAKKGESYFRKVEKEILENTLPQKPTIIATGGGTPCFFENMKFLNKHGISVFIEQPLTILSQRITRTNERPLWNKKGVQQIEKELEISYKKRLPFYQQANICFETAMTFETLLAKIQQQLQKND